jgi:hypothetical protein
VYRVGGERLEVRLDPDRRRKIAELARTYQVGVSEMVRKMIDDAYEDVLLERRRAAVQKIFGASELATEPMPDPDELARQLDETYAVKLEYDED